MVLVVSFWKALELRPIEIAGLPHVKSLELLEVGVVVVVEESPLSNLKAGLAGGAFAAWRV